MYPFLIRCVVAGYLDGAKASISVCPGMEATIGTTYVHPQPSTPNLTPYTLNSKP